MNVRTIVLVLAILVTAHASALAQAQPCACDEMGLDVAWADSLRLECYRVRVPQDRLDPGAGWLNLAVAVAPAVDDAGEPPLLYLHGGPGFDSISNMPRYLDAPAWRLFREQHDIVFFDYRGTGASEPRMCPSLMDSLAAFVRTNPSPEALAREEARILSRCADELSAAGIRRSTFTSAQLAADADAIRSALGIAAWNVYGVSFGTTVALHSLRDFAEGISRVILDSTFPPNAPWPDFVRPMDLCLHALDRAIRNDDAAAAVFTGFRRDFDIAVRSLDAVPIVIDGQDFTGGDFAWSVWTAMLRPRAIPLVPLMVHEVAHGRRDAVGRWAAQFDNLDIYGKFSTPQSWAIMCWESRPRQPEDTADALQLAFPDLAPFLDEVDESVCDAYRPEIAPPEYFAAVTSDVPVLLLSGELDPVTPPLFGDIAAATLSRAIHLRFPSASHAAVNSSECAWRIALEFLLEPEAALHTKCIEQIPAIRFITRDLEQALADSANRR